MSTPDDHLSTVGDLAGQFRAAANGASRTILTIGISLLVSWIAVIEPTYSEFRNVVQDYEAFFLDNPSNGKATVLGILTSRLSTRRLLERCLTETTDLITSLENDIESTTRSRNPFIGSEDYSSFIEADLKTAKADELHLSRCVSGATDDSTSCASNRRLMRYCNRSVGWEFSNLPVRIEASDFYLHANEGELLAWQAAEQRIAAAVAARKSLRDNATFEVLGTSVPVRKTLAVLVWTSLLLFLLLYIEAKRRLLARLAALARPADGGSDRIIRSSTQQPGIKAEDVPFWFMPLETIHVGNGGKSSTHRALTEASFGKPHLAIIAAVLIIPAVLIQARVAWIGFMLTDDYRAVVETSSLWPAPFRASALVSDLILTGLLGAILIMIWRWWGAAWARLVTNEAQRRTERRQSDVVDPWKRNVLLIGGAVSATAALRSVLNWPPSQQMQKFAQLNGLHAPFVRFIERRREAFWTDKREGFYTTRDPNSGIYWEPRIVHYVSVPDAPDQESGGKAQIRNVKHIYKDLVAVDVLDIGRGSSNSYRETFRGIRLISEFGAARAVEMAALQRVNSDRQWAKSVLRTAVEYDVVIGFRRERIARRIYDLLATLYAIEADDRELGRFVGYLESVLGGDQHFRFARPPEDLRDVRPWLRSQLVFTARNRGDIESRIAKWRDEKSSWRKARLSRDQPIEWSWSGSDGVRRSVVIQHLSA